VLRMAEDVVLVTPFFRYVYRTTYVRRRQLRQRRRAETTATTTVAVATQAPLPRQSQRVMALAGGVQCGLYTFSRAYIYCTTRT